MQEHAMAAVEHTEARAVMWSKWTDPFGAEWSVTLRQGCSGAMAAELVKDSEGLSAYLLKRDWRPAGSRFPGETPDEERVCPKHNVPMTRHTKGSDSWWSHKHGDSWCRGDDR